MGWAAHLANVATSTAQTAATALLAALPDLRAHGNLPDACDEILDAHAQATRAVDAPAHRAIITIGACPEAACQGTIRAFIPADTRPARMACDIGDHTWGTRDWLRIGGHIQQMRERMSA
ncbi:hypothetical protein [Modestobacter sp. VKM Ac-2985]|uniref:hypothetical protein n=1 Tax=Modestobacter sp. VKM Ac-2985 TaxID=3004139 RepID=UPI0022AB5593|nr:hypothetical protein [Modestobacter sp. VKM Ac-2985]MCZ2839918.1 hypothetical protein [Modestobacter sp. VKM Ac-2985]